MSALSGDTCLFSMLYWDFHTEQRLYEYTSPVPLKAGETVRVGCTFLTENLGFDLSAGSGPDDEECSLYLYATNPAP